LLLCLTSGCVIGGGDDTTASVFIGDGGEAGAGEGGPPKDATTPSADAADSSAPRDATVAEGAPPSGSVPTASVSTSPIDFGSVPCGAPAATHSVVIGNTGSAPLAVSASTTGTAFAVSPSTLTVAPGSSGTLALAATVQGSAAAGAALTGSLGIFTNDPTQGSLSIPLTATPTGATLVLTSGGTGAVTFPATLVGGAAASTSFSITNNGNAAASVSITDPAPNIGVSFLPGALSSTAPVMVAPHASVTANVQYAPTAAGNGQSATSSVMVTATAMCGTNLSSVGYAGSAVLGTVSGWPASVEFQNAYCGGAAPSAQTFALKNPGTTDEQVTDCHIVEPDGTSVPCTAALGPADGSAAPVFTASLGASTIPANGSLTVTVQASPVPSTSSLTVIGGTLSMTLNPPLSTSLASLPLHEYPTGAVLAFDSKTFGSFPSPIILLGAPADQSFNVLNTGNWPASGGADVTLSVVAGAGDAGVDASGPSAFAVLTPSLSVPVGGASAERNDSMRFAPVVAGANAATLTMSVDPSTPLCAPLPSASLLGTGVGAGASVVPSTLSFLAPCNGTAPAPQSFTVTNSGALDMTWQLGPVTGAGAARYTTSATPAPGLLGPGQSATVTVTAQPFDAMPAGGAPVNPDPTTLAAEVVVTTDIPFDMGRAVSLGEIPVGDQLALSTSRLNFGQFPAGQTTVAQAFTVTNAANLGSPDAHYSLVVQGAGAASYSMSPAASSVGLSAQGTSAPESVTFSPMGGVPYPATVALTTTDAVLCAPLPPPLVLAGTGTSGHVSVAPGTVVFGDGPSGLVDCGTTAPVQTLTVTNTMAAAGGNQAFNVTSISLGKQGAAAPFTFATSPATPVPFSVPVGGSFSVTLTPQAIPAVADPNDATSFQDVLTITTDSTGDMPHTIPLVMQPRGAVIVQPPLETTWNFGTIGLGSLGTFSTSFQNTGNDTVSMALVGLAQPNVFALALGPTAASGITPIIGQFTPTALDGNWSDQGSLVMTAASAFCSAPPAPWQATSPTIWTGPAIALSGASNSNPPISISATALAFPTTDCGNAPPAGQTLTLTNNTNQPQPFSARILASVHPNSYSLSGPFTAADAGFGAGTIPPMGVASLVVTPNGVVPGPGVLAGSYAATIEIDIATTPTTTYTVPLSWALSGAVLSLVPGGTPFTDGRGLPFYLADSATGHALPISNTGTSAVTLDFTIQPPGAFAFTPQTPLAILPGLVAAPQLSDLAAAPMCPPSPVTAGAATPIYVSGAVCQPLSFSTVAGPVSIPAVSIYYCAGTF
jgi:hypothetical protein